jgi:hypothetical protein
MCSHRLWCLLLWGITHLRTADPQQLSGQQLSAGALPGVSDRPAFTNSPANYSVTQGTHHGEYY